MRCAGKSLDAIPSTEKAAESWAAFFVAVFFCYTARILKGSKPSDLPVVQSSKLTQNDQPDPRAVACDGDCVLNFAGHRLHLKRWGIPFPRSNNRDGSARLLPQLADWLQHRSAHD